jgi:hypothetical protein
MADEPAVATVSRCPWCSAQLPSGTLAACPSCGATLSGSGSDEQLPGVTTLDTEAILRARASVSRPRSRLLSFITGDVDEGGGALGATPGSIAPPSDEVRREMLKMELAAEVANLEAEVQARVVEAEVEAREAGLVDPATAVDVPPVHTTEETEAAIEQAVASAAEHAEEPAAS